MNNIITIKNVRGYLDKDGTAHLNLEDVARGLGFVQKQNKNGKEYESIRWERIAGYLVELGFPHGVGEKSEIVNLESEELPDFIPENIFYKLCFKASNEVAKKFQNMVCDEILPTIRKSGTYSIQQSIPINNNDVSVITATTGYIREIRRAMKEQGNTPQEIAAMIEQVCGRYKLPLPKNFVKKLTYEQISLTITLEKS